MRRRTIHRNEVYTCGSHTHLGSSSPESSSHTATYYTHHTDTPPQKLLAQSCGSLQVLHTHIHTSGVTTCSTALDVGWQTSSQHRLLAAPAEALSLLPALTLPLLLGLTAIESVGSMTVDVELRVPLLASLGVMTSLCEADRVKQIM